ncbi:tropomyosin-like [Ananas comosus]|uniref:Tropomyosin-like n=2 Tax=Ananas comosus TaxID=4615 RepID=A0A6P5GUI0_ANACO|nr:tropomyosin-like [Ananas comosus]
MDLPPETDEFIRESIESSLGLQISAKNMQMKLLASEDARHRLQDQIFVLEERLRESERRLEQFRAEASMNAQALRRSIEEKEMIASGYNESINNCAKLERECSLYERDLERVMESYDELAKENDELRARLQDNSALTSLAAEVESLQREKEQVRINLNRAEAEVKVLFDENKILDEENKRLLGLLKRERHLMGSEGKRSASASAKGKRKSSVKDSSPTGRALDFGSADSSRQPLSPLHQNTPDSRMHKK